MKKLAFSVLTVWMTIVLIQPVHAETPAFFSEINCIETVNDYDYQCRRFQDDDERIPLSEVGFGFIEDLFIPGMPGSLQDDLAANRIPDTSIIPQGICIAGDYLVTSSYNEKKDRPGCLFLFDARTKEYLATLGLYPGSHLGGIAFDGENLWICHYEQNLLQRIPYPYLQAVGRSASRQFVDISEEADLYPVNNSPSCITYYNGRLYVATFQLLFLSEMKGYRYKDGVLLEENVYPIPPLVQGLAFTENGQVYFSTSYGRRNSSYLKRYANLAELARNAGKPDLVLEMPPCSEEICMDAGRLLVFFESAAQKYYKGTDGFGKSRAPLDKVLTIELDSLP